MGEILIGFEVGTGEAVHIDPDHLLGTGLTQQSGKTTTLNAIIYRGGRRAIAFRTKRGEIDMDVAQHLQPFYRQPRRSRSKFIDRRYVQYILEASEERRMRFEEAWIIRACDRAQTLRDVYENIQRLQGDATRGLDKDQYLKLEAYFKDILPQLEEREWATTLPLVNGVNLMDLEPLSDEVQCLVIERTIDYVLRNMKDVIIVLPEARKFIPLGSRTPVTSTAIRMASEGAVLDLDLWVDSQTYSSIDNEVRKQCGTQIHGVQMDNNEARTISDLLDKRWDFRAVKKLRLGHFFVKTKDKRYKHVYVLPAGVPEEMGRRVAMGELKPEAVKDYLAQSRAQKIDGDEEMYRSKYEESQRELEESRAREEGLKEELRESHIDGEDQGLRDRVSTLEGEKKTQAIELNDLRDKVKRFEGVDVKRLKETMAALRKDLEIYSTFKGLLVKMLDVDQVKAVSSPESAAAPVDMSMVATLVDERLAQVLRESPPERVVAINLSEAARELIREDFTSNMAELIGGLTPEPRRAALIIREHGTIKTRDLYFHVRGKESRGRLPVNFNTMVKKLENIGLATRNPNAGLISWTLHDLVDGRLIDVADEEARRQLEEYLASLLLPGDQG